MNINKFCVKIVKNHSNMHEILSSFAHAHYNLNPPFSQLNNSIEITKKVHENHHLRCFSHLIHDYITKRLKIKLKLNQSNYVQQEREQINKRSVKHGQRVK